MLKQLKITLRKKGGNLAIVSSPVGYRGLPKSTGYTPSKAALNNFTQGIYFDFKKYNINVTLISPGFIKTQLTDKMNFYAFFKICRVCC